jgi:hypothetical protein
MITVAWLVVYLAVGAGAALLLGALLAPLEVGPWWLARNGLIGAAGFVVATVVVGRWLDRHDWCALGWTAPRALPRWFGLGLLLGAGMAAAAVAVTLVDGAAVAVTGLADGFLPVAGPLAVGMAAAALTEELLFRGYPLRRLADIVGPGIATLIAAAAFALAHLRNAHAGTLGVVNIALAAVWLSVAFFSAGGMSLAWGLHTGWNAALSLAFDAPVSGVRFDVPGVDYALSRHAWVGGGAFGPEGGVAATVVLLAGTAALLAGRLRHPSRWFEPAAGAPGGRAG